MKNSMGLNIEGLALGMILLTAVGAEACGYPKAKVSYPDFKSLVSEVEAHRADRLISLNQFLQMSKEPGVIILDTRSKLRFDRLHVKGAKHLNFSDFTQDNLARIIPSKETKVLIYCNNNFEGNQVDFTTKSAAPVARNRNTPSGQIAAEERPVMLALNTPTLINLYGYGYRNVYELDELINVTDPRISFAGKVTHPPTARNAAHSLPLIQVQQSLR